MPSVYRFYDNYLCYGKVEVNSNPAEVLSKGRMLSEDCILVVGETLEFENGEEIFEYSCVDLKKQNNKRACFHGKYTASELLTAIKEQYPHK